MNVIKKIWEVIKKLGLTFWFTVVAGILTLTATIIFGVTNSTAGYSVEKGPLGIALGVLAVVLIGVSAFTTYKFGAQNPITAALKLVALIFVCVDISLLVMSRAILASALFTWDAYNDLGWSVLYTSIGAVVVAVIAILVLIVTAFMNNRKIKS